MIWKRFAQRAGSAGSSLRLRWGAQDPPLNEAARARLAEYEVIHARWDELTVPLCEELAQAGWPVSTVWDLVASEEEYPSAIPVLLRWAPEFYDDHGPGEWVLRALAKPWAHEQVVPAFLEWFPKITLDDNRWLIADGFERMWRNVPLEPLIAWLFDPTIDPHSRCLLLPTVGKHARRHESARQALTDAVATPELSAHAMEWVLKRKLTVPREYVEQHLNDHRAWARRDATKLLAQLDEQA